MRQVITYNLTDNFIQKIGELIEERFLGEGKELSRVAVVFGGKRPSFFLKRELSKRIKNSFLPPAFFSIDEFIEYILEKKLSIRRLSELDASYIIYSLVKDISRDILKGRETFSAFIAWAREILSFIDLLDIEDVENSSLEDIRMNAAIGYEVPESINGLLKNIISLRDAYHDYLKDRGTYSRGLMYLTAFRIMEDIEFAEYDSILFCNFFYLHKTEENIIRHLYASGKAILAFQGTESEWPVLKKISRSLSCKIEPARISKPGYNLSIHAGFDMHSEVCIVREILKKIKDLGDTVIVLPEAESLAPLLSEIAYLVKDFNVSMGYPLRRSSLYTLFESIFRAQETKKGTGYYTRDYLRVLSHPFVKNLGKASHPSISRVLVHKIEDVLTGAEETHLAGNLFIKLEDIEGLKELYPLTLSTLKNMDIESDPEEIKNGLKEIHGLLFYSWEKIRNFHDFSNVLETFLDVLVDKSPLAEYPINLKIVEKLLILKEDLGNAVFSRDEFPDEDIFKIFQEELESQVISFSGSPLKGLQILGLFETRSLSFQNVIILDTNESVLPRLKVYEPLIPREVMLSFGINRLEEEEEIQRYQFMRLISSARNVFLVYDAGEDKERSRFIEELIWEKEKEAVSLGVVPVEHGSFQTSVAPGKAEIHKNRKVTDFLRRHKYSSTSINTYLNCPAMFYYQYVLGIKEKDDFLEEPEGLHIGKFIHEILEETFKRFEGKAPSIDREFRESFFEIFSSRFDNFFARRMKADSFLLKEVMRFRLEMFLDREEEREVDEIVSLEREFESEVKTGKGSYNFTSRVDRIDRLKDGSLFIIDYKTGGEALIPKALKRLEGMELTRVSIRDRVQSFQLPLYLYLVRSVYKDCRIRSGLYHLKDLKIKTFPREKEEEMLEESLEICMKALGFIIEEILNPEVPFTPDGDSGYCKNCAFFYMCR